MNNVNVKRNGTIVEHCRDCKMYAVPVQEPPTIDLKSSIDMYIEFREPTYFLVCPGCNYTEGPLTPGEERFVCNGNEFQLRKDEHGKWWWHDLD